MYARHAERVQRFGGEQLPQRGPQAAAPVRARRRAGRRPAAVQLQLQARSPGADHLPMMTLLTARQTPDCRLFRGKMKADEVVTR